MAQQLPVKVLVTGFGPFPGVPVNPSGLLMEWLKDSHARTCRHLELKVAIVPTSWDAVDRFVSGPLAEFDPDIALHFGVSSRARGFQLEQTARNSASRSADCEGKIFGRPCIIRGAPERRRSTFDARQLARKLQARGLSASVSRDAGRYLCNMLLYHSLQQAHGRSHTRQTGFVHIPPLAPCNRLGSPPRNNRALLAGFDIILNHCICAQRRNLRGVGASN
jgi:pyroglutamyl-peptidase